MASTTSTPYPTSATASTMSSTSTPYPREDKKATLKKALTMKLQKELQKFYQEIRVEIDAEFERQDQLEKGQDMLNGAGEAVGAKKIEVQKCVNAILERNAALEDWLEEHEAAGTELNVDDAIAPSDVVSGQLIECLAKVATAEDMLYHLDKALNDQSIDLKSFLRIVRKISRDMFMSKALAMKIAQKLESPSSSR